MGKVSDSLISELHIDKESKKIFYRVCDLYKMGTLETRIEDETLWEYIASQDSGESDKARIVCVSHLRLSLRGVIPTKSIIDLVEHMSDDLLFKVLFSIICEARIAHRKFMGA